MKDRVALITGGNKGIGKQIALDYASAGAKVIITARDVDSLQSTAKMIEDQGGDALSIPCDVTDTAQVDSMVEQSLSTYGQIDILVNNAGVAKSHKLVDHPDDLWNWIMDVNLTAVYQVTKRVVPSMIEGKWGRIINMGSIASKMGNAYMVAYTASKHGLLGLTRALAVELNRYNITVNTICPGYVDTPMTQAAIENVVKTTGRSREEAEAYFNSTTPQKRLFDVDEISHVALMLAGDSARGITGQAINVDGGTAMF